MRKSKFNIIFLFIVSSQVGILMAATNEWSNAGSGISAAVNVVDFHEGHLDTLYAGSVHGLYRSDDGGRNWQLRGVSLIDRNILSLAINPQKPKTVYAGTRSGMWLSEDAGSTWAAVAGFDTGVLSLSTGINNRVYAGTFGQGVFRSLDGGDTWANISSGFLSEIIFCVVVHPLNPDIVYAGTDNGMYKSTDAGVNWTLMDEFSGLSVRSIAIGVEAGSGSVNVGTFGQGVFISSDGGNQWQASNNGLTDLNVRAIAIDSESPGVFFAGTSSEGFYRSKDSGRTWSSINNGLSNLSVRTISLISGDERRVLVGTAGSGVYSIDFVPEPIIRTSVYKLDLGAVKVSETDFKMFEIYNDGTEELIVSEIITKNTGNFSVSLKDFVIPVGGSKQIQIDFHPVAVGDIVENIEIKSNDRDTPVSELEVIGLGQQVSLILTPSEVQFDDVALDSYVDTFIVLSNIGNISAKLRNAYFENDSFRLMSILPNLLLPGNEIKLQLRFIPSIAKGISSRFVVLGEDDSKVEATVDGVGSASELTLSTTNFDFSTVELVSDSLGVVLISNSGNISLRVDELSVDGQGFTVASEESFVVEPAQEHRVVIRFSPQTAGEYVGQLVIRSDARINAEVRVPLRGIGSALALRAQNGLHVGRGISRMLNADLDANGAIDIVLADSVAGSLRILLNDGNGNFGTQQRIPSNSVTYGDWDSPNSMAVAPIYGEAPDLIVADPMARTLSVLRNNGAGDLASDRNDIYIGYTVAAVLPLDVDADGDFDLATANSDAASVMVLQNNGRGTFSTRDAYQVALSPTDLTGGNLNEDVYPDIVVANSGSGSVSIMLGDGSGKFDEPYEIQVGLGTTRVHIADIDADGDNDIIAANQESKDIAIVLNDGDGTFYLDQRVPVGLAPIDMDLSDLTLDVFSDIVVVGGDGDFLTFIENNGNSNYSTRQVVTAKSVLSDVAIFDVNNDGANDIVAIAPSDEELVVFLNEDARRGDAPRPPTKLTANDLGQDLGRRVELQWVAPEIDEQLGRTTHYVIYRADDREGDYVAIDTVGQGLRRYVDVAATLVDTFFYNVVASNASVSSTPSDTVWAISQPAPFFEFEVRNEGPYSIGDTIAIRTFLIPTVHSVTGISLYLSYDDSSLTLIDALTDSLITNLSKSLSAAVPFNVDGLFTGRVYQNKLHDGEVGKVDLSILHSVGTALVDPGIDPVYLGELRFVANVEDQSILYIDNDVINNRISAIADVDGSLVMPFIPAIPLEIAVSDFLVRGNIKLQGWPANTGSAVTVLLYDEAGKLFMSPSNDLDPLKFGIQRLVDRNGDFNLRQVPPGSYDVLVKSPTHLQVRAQGGKVVVGEELADTTLSFEWVGRDTSSILLAGDANDDNRINLADFALLVDFFNQNVAQEPKARQSDFNGDDTVNIADFFLLAENFGLVGMEWSLPASKRSRIVYELERGQYGGLRLSNSLSLRGMALLVGGDSPNDLTITGSIWDRPDVVTRIWQEKNGLRIASVLTDGAVEAGAGSPVLGLPSDMSLLSGELLMEDGRILRVGMKEKVYLNATNKLLNNYPNPFNPQTTIPFVLANDSHIDLKIYNSLGQIVRSLFSGQIKGGSHNFNWDGRNDVEKPVASGIYFYRLRVKDQAMVRRLLLVR
ncbi:MAG: FG-GAP-like repeat-containing protein [Candidatus Latescibacterota bacterium]|nr:FG-GAP-like repeat-containing protein [Candidatus Latescibacterota bacterium]